MSHEMKPPKQKSHTNHLPTEMADHFYERNQNISTQKESEGEKTWPLSPTLSLILKTFYSSKWNISHHLNLHIHIFEFTQKNSAEITLDWTLTCIYKNYTLNSKTPKNLCVLLLLMMIPRHPLSQNSAFSIMRDRVLHSWVSL